MRRKNSTTRRSLCVCTAAWFCGDALVADPASAADSTLAEVIVTGTRLTVEQSDSTAPVTVLDRRDIDRNGADSAAKVLRVLPMNTGSPNGTNVNNDGRSKPLMIPLSSSLTQVMTKRDREATESRYGIAAILTDLAHSQFLASQANRLICCRG